MRTKIISLLLLCLIVQGTLDAQTRKKRRVKRKPSVELLKNIQITEGVHYTHEYYPRTFWSVHTLTADISNPSLNLKMTKALNHVGGLERVYQMAHRLDSSLAAAQVIAAMNSNFWKAGTNYVIGPAVSDGIFINNLRYKNWSSLVVTQKREFHIDRFSFFINALTSDSSFRIHAVNRRMDSTSISLYTSYFGPSVPFIDTLGIRSASEDTLTDSSELDSLATAVIDSLWYLNPERGTYKCQFLYTSEPVVNGDITCLVTAVDTGTMIVPNGGGVLSFGYGVSAPPSKFSPGGYFILRSNIDPPLDTPVQQMATGTPRLVRNGVVSVEWEEEGLRKRSFVTGRYGRSAVGISRNGKKIILVTVENTIRRKNQRGIGLHDLARLLRAKGAYNAMNFDGGSSATMVVNRQTVAPENGNSYSRKVASAILLIDSSMKSMQK